MGKVCLDPSGVLISTSEPKPSDRQKAAELRRQLMNPLDHLGLDPVGERRVRVWINRHIYPLVHDLSPDFRALYDELASDPDTAPDRSATQMLESDELMEAAESAYDEVRAR